MTIATRRQELALTQATRARDVLDLQAEVAEGCLWLEQKHPAHCRHIERELNKLHSRPDDWWRQRIHRPLGWWLAFLGIPGYEPFRYDP